MLAIVIVIWNSKITVNLIEPIVQVGTGNQAGRIIKSRIKNGANIMNLYCYNNSYENKLTGILVSVTTENQSKYCLVQMVLDLYQTAPLLDSVILKRITYLPIVALWNSSYKSFIINNNTLGLMQTNAKKLNIHLHVKMFIFNIKK